MCLYQKYKYLVTYLTSVKLRKRKVQKVTFNYNLKNYQVKTKLDKMFT